MSYTAFSMKGLFASATLLIIGSALAASAAVSAESQYQQATILSIEQKATTRVVYYVVDTPITKDDPYYDVAVQLKDMVYTARYTPRHKYDVLPDEWKTGATVQARVHGRHLFVKAPGGTEVDLVITKKKALPKGEAQPAPGK